MTLGFNLMTSNFKSERAVKIVWGSLNKCICFRERVVPLGCGSEASPGWVSRKMITKLARNCQLSLARHWHEFSWNLTLTLRELPVDSLISGASTWHLMAWATVLFPNKILKFNPGYHSLTRVYCAQQMTVSSPESQSKNYDENCQSALKQADALDTSHGEYTTVTDSQIGRGEVTADSSLPPSDIKHPDKVSSILWTWSEHGSVTCLWSACVSMWGL